MPSELEQFGNPSAFIYTEWQLATSVTQTEKVQHGINRFAGFVLYV